MPGRDVCCAGTEDGFGRAARSIEEVPIDARSVLRREDAPDPERDRLRERFLELVRNSNRTEEQEQELKEVGELKKILATSRKTDFYRCLTEKMLTYALGRAVEYGDIPTVDAIVESLESDRGRASLLIDGIIRSAAFQRTVRPELAVPTAITDLI